MIRVVIVVLVLVLIWVLFLSNFPKRTRIILASLVVMLALLGAWFDGLGQNPKTGLVEPSQLSVCGLEVAYTYRTNFDVTLCLNNTATHADVTRVRYTIIAEQCVRPSECQQLAQVTRDTLFTIPAGSQSSKTQNLDFKPIDAKVPNLNWRATVDSVKAIK